ncbi:TonB-dependent siderophore receptor [Xylophilus sp.]|uniref:TonB-dependent siderophore receptor n=1 Tax=Xylophilus sp. TaxID=2653893 RepID=UPI0013B6BE47|nr:TonB-dependent receptor [Xylophilus sp.]KAF1049287.1 MAG: Fe(3+)-pyochelin receptor [Xylophilus sp.]
MHPSRLPRRTRLSAVLAAALIPLGVQAQQAVAIDLPAAPLEQSLNQLARATGVQIVFASPLAAGRQAPAVRGMLSAQDALARLLAGSGLVAHVADGGRTWVVERAAAPAPGAAATTSTLGEVRVTAAAETGATTEGLPEYAARAAAIGLGEHSLRETPNSVSVVTRQRIEDQNFLTVEDAMRYTTAMKVTTYGTNNYQIESRGYGIDRYQVDGVSSSARTYENNFGLAMYDRVEVWRGPAGLLQGAGDPGGTVNFVRKRAQNTFGFNARTSVGSWDNYYGEADVTGPLNADGSLRGRLVAAYQDQHYFTDYTFSRQPMVYGTLEYDVDADTTLSVGHSTQRLHMRPFYGYSTYSDGTLPDIDRSTFVGALWNRRRQTANRSFAELEHRLAGGGRLVLSASYLDRTNDQAYAWGNTFIDRATGNETLIPYIGTTDEQEANFQAVATLPTQWRGLKQEFVLGASHQRLRSQSTYNAATWGQNGFVQNTFAPAYGTAQPAIATQTTASSDVRQESLFGQARIRPWLPLVLLAGARVTWYENRNLLNRALDAKIDAKAVPYAGVVYELTPQWSAYGSYTRIFNPQTSTDRTGAYLKPREGNQVEAGVKGEHLDGRLQSSIGLYRIEDINRAMTDPDFPNASVAAGKVRSQGLEAELTGRLSPRWNLTAGYGYNTTEYLRASAAQQGQPFTTVYPRHLFSLWSDWRADGGWSLGAGARVRSAIYAQSGTVRWTAGGVTVFALQGGYQINPKTRVTVTVNNLFDRHYWDRVVASGRLNYYGEPRAVTATLSYKY